MTTPPVHFTREPVGGGTRFLAVRDGAPLPCDQALDLLARDPVFREDLSALLAGCGYPSFRWETPPLSRDRIARPFEFVLIDSPGLAPNPEPHAFARYFDAASADTSVLAVPNLGGTAMLVVPRQLAAPGVYCHLASFLRGAPPAQVHQLWQLVAATVMARLSDRPLWLSTAGGGVSWLHVRIEGTPKYYRHRPYTGDLPPRR